MTQLNDLKRDLQKLATPARAKASMWFFKTDEGQYGAHDTFIGVKVPDQRKIAKQYRTLPLPQVGKLLHSPIHEHRLTALFILVHQFEKGDEAVRKMIKNMYLKNTAHVNNWDLVDSSAGYILGSFLAAQKDRKILYSLARSQDLWKKRIAIIATQAFIRDGQFADTLAIAQILLHDTHDLIHKAVGWMLREVGNRDQRAEEIFLQKHAHIMPRTMLRYAIEKFPSAAKQKYMQMAAKKWRKKGKTRPGSR
ncbi:MAG: DNA alkylation repair protein [Candidatus Kerfeldbacteria bacterium RIFCSPHIGHO2_12_FULL_48_17]|uniref:DNA alkylation repair protein n=1 Tax=Candidatus Kerfeldbacteria bacterium RIFCSPHIGHO2_12_FULL_48_17 TaxID=1798542 RepID=A0A1G2B765_9BACT|nr:MAG: DNA alkylation repair protein [Candidatus Kerfeldbacteria bacterium RIFCSPHIGHO2_12_FULL_48_17]